MSWTLRTKTTAQGGRDKMRRPVACPTARDLRFHSACLLASLLPLAAVAGCSQFIDPNVPEPIRNLTVRSGLD